MAGLSLKITLDDLDGGIAVLDGIIDRSADLSVPMKFAARQLERSVAENFQAGGRPDRWPALADSTLLAKAPKMKPLIDSGRLMNSIVGDSGSDWARVGTSVVYAAVHQSGHTFNQIVTVPAHERVIRQAFGKSISPRTVRVREHQMRMNTTIPARPYLMVQDEDMEIIGEAVMEYLTKG